MNVDVRRPTLETALRVRQVATNHARVVTQLGKDIVSGRFGAGEILPGDLELAERFQVSRTVLREALKTLDAKGLISPRVRIGTSVRTRREWNHFDAEVLLWYIETGVDARLLGQLREIRLALEPRAAALAARNADAAQLAAITGAIGTLLSEGLPPEETVAAMLDVHVGVATASANVFVQSSEALLKAALIGAFRYDPAMAERAGERFGEAYGALARALGDRQPETAFNVMEKVVLTVMPGM